MSFRSTKHGVFTPHNIAKYVGSQLPVYRSSWELRAFMALDRNEKILRWGSENFVIPYVDTTRNNETHRYIVDLFFEIKDYTKNGLPIKWLLEIKPENQATIVQSKRGKSTESLLTESIIVTRNKCKWKAAVGFCQARGWHFGVYTENGINKLC